MLRAECAQEISGQVKEAAKNIHLDPVVMKTCQTEVIGKTKSCERRRSVWSE